MSHYYIQPPTKEVARIERWDYATRKEYGIV